MSDIKTWSERCEVHPDHQSGMVSHAMIQMRMQEEIDDLRAENERLSKAMTDLLWYVAQLETLAYDKDDAGEHESVTRARAALKENSDE